ncbi:DUF2515 family protein [Rhizobium oryziradicis]|uniref:Uncharacterized protein n=1 Tax=Rhizobium oryziradicis TaxID=1867956 RepID=A0A1Q8ZMF4_9HYPH|nr:hypothetical protein [Rhizobium oryziradicis]OLP43059.1 hypothetical protein BJF95_19145 [Rhizobium oryziradicis]
MTSQSNQQPTVSASELKRAEAGAEKDAAPGNVSETCQACIAADCKKKIEEIEKKTKSITDIQDPIERNKAITAAYKNLFAENPQNRWIKLASIVSSQVGCSLNDAKSWRDGLQYGADGGPAFGYEIASNMYDALGEGNRNIFQSIYPMAVYQARYGYEDMKKCYAALGKQIPKRVNEAFESLESGNLKDAADALGNYEQREIVPPLYEKYNGTFSVVEAGNSVYKNLPWNSGKNIYDIPVSYNCGAPNPVPFNSPISNTNRRVDYYQSLMQRLTDIEKWKW